ncbi:MAG: DNA alkylation response protein, partial [Alphaproteobacteria bacterium]|nr:DNA alkylation response protein [Alphaproteobacteria bacterium]
IAKSGNETLARQASDALYHAASAVLMACEGAQLGAAGHDARRLLLARMVVTHRLSPRDPLAAGEDEDAITDALLSPEPVDLNRAAALVAA